MRRHRVRRPRGVALQRWWQKGNALAVPTAAFLPRAPVAVGGPQSLSVEDHLAGLWCVLGLGE